MATRREFLQAGIAASALPFGAEAFTPEMPRPVEVAAASDRPALPAFYKVVFDERFPESVAFAGEMKRLGAAVHAIAGDITDLWYHDLHAQWLKSPAPIAGLTAHGPLFCLERLAWDHGMRIVFRAEHQYRSDACVEHLLSVPEAVLPHAAALQGAGASWSVQMASLLSRCSPAGPQASTRIVAPLGNVVNPGDTDRDPLFSWIIGPVVRA